jgi:hypothetical protein
VQNGKKLVLRANGRIRFLTPELSKIWGFCCPTFRWSHNSTSRQAVKDYADRTGTTCLHAGLSTDYAEVIWNEVYRVPSDVNDDVCDYPLARNLVMLTMAVACEAIVSFVATGEQRHFTITLKDLSVQSLNL